MMCLVFVFGLLLKHIIVQMMVVVGFVQQNLFPEGKEEAAILQQPCRS
jgi:hypothetical protein